MSFAYKRRECHQTSERTTHSDDNEKSTTRASASAHIARACRRADAHAHSIHTHIDTYTHVHSARARARESLLRTLRVCQVVAFIVVHRETERTIKRAVVVLAKVGIFRQVDRFERQLTQSFFALTKTFVVVAAQEQQTNISKTYTQQKRKF